MDEPIRSTVTKKELARGCVHARGHTVRPGRWTGPSSRISWVRPHKEDEEAEEAEEDEEDSQRNVLDTRIVVPKKYLYATLLGDPPPGNNWPGAISVLAPGQF